jgi:hypothetical protein
LRASSSGASSGEPRRKPPARRLDLHRRTGHEPGGKRGVERDAETGRRILQQRHDRRAGCRDRARVEQPRADPPREGRADRRLGEPHLQRDESRVHLGQRRLELRELERRLVHALLRDMARGEEVLLPRVRAPGKLRLRPSAARDASRRVRSASRSRVSSRATTAPADTASPSRTRTSATVPPSSKPSTASCAASNCPVKRRVSVTLSVRRSTSGATTVRGAGGGPSACEARAASAP